MKIQLKRARLNYEAHLKRPNFNLAENSARNAELIYKRISESFSISSSNFQIFTGASLSDYALKVVLFAGVGVLEFKFDSYKASFDSLSNEQDLAIVLECIRLVEAAASDLQASDFVQVNVTYSGWYACDDGLQAITERLSTFKPSGLTIEAGFAGASDISFVLNGTLGNPAERWSHNFSIEPSVNPQLGDVYLHLTGRYGEGGRYNSLEERQNHFESLGSAILNTCGFEFDTGEKSNESE